MPCKISEGLSPLNFISLTNKTVDLPKNVLSGLRHAIGVLKDVNGISITEFNSKDVVRHPLVKKMIDAYADHENS